MRPTMIDSSYGKARIRFVKVTRKDSFHHDYKQVMVQVLLEGDFNESYTHGDNSNVVPTDTCKNIVFVVAHRHAVDSIESFGMELGKTFLSEYSHVDRVLLKIEENIWNRLEINGRDHPHSFIKMPHVRFAKLVCDRNNVKIDSGVKGLTVLKTTMSGFVNFHKCKYTTLPEVDDRLLGTSLKMNWNYTDLIARNGFKDVNFNGIWQRVIDCIFDTFANEYSPSVQQTIYSSASKVLFDINEIETISFSLPNIHNFLVDYAKLKLPPSDNVLLCIDEPHGLIKATIGRTNKPKL